jgi:hypothetical protein
VCFVPFSTVSTPLVLLTSLQNDELSSGYFPGVWVLKADGEELCVGSIFNRWSTCWRWKRHRVPQRRLLIFRRRGNTQKTIFQNKDPLLVLLWASLVSQPSAVLLCVQMCHIGNHYFILWYSSNKLLACLNGAYSWHTHLVIPNVLPVRTKIRYMISSTQSTD